VCDKVVLPILLIIARETEVSIFPLVIVGGGAETAEVIMALITLYQAVVTGFPLAKVALNTRGEGLAPTVADVTVQRVTLHCPTTMESTGDIFLVLVLGALSSSLLHDDH
jgi:hypothetical protein